MKNIKFNLFIFLIPWVFWANNPTGKFKTNKVIKRDFDVATSGRVVIDNSYGNINIVTSTQNRVRIIVTISVDGNDKEAVNKRLNGIDVSIDGNGNLVSAKTKVASLNTNWSFFSWIVGKSDSHTNFKIDYQVFMPEQWDLKIYNDYGNIYIDRLQGNLDLEADYGNFQIGMLYGNDNKISTDYFSKSHIDYVKNATINADYSNVEIGQAKYLDLNCDYTNINIDHVTKLAINNDYGSINVKRVEQVNARGDYQTRTFGMVTDFKFSGDYGSLKIEGLDVDFKHISLSGDYTNIKIYNPKRVPYLLNLSQDYGCFKQEGLTIYKEIIHITDKKIEGFFKNREAEAQINVKMDYGCLKIIN